MKTMALILLIVKRMSVSPKNQRRRLTAQEFVDARFGAGLGVVANRDIGT
jgi:hypothetical protein